MSILVLTSVATGDELDRVSLVDDKLRYVTGRAQPILESPRRMNASLPDSKLFELGSGWSNGYLQLKEA